MSFIERPLFIPVPQLILLNETPAELVLYLTHLGHMQAWCNGSTDASRAFGRGSNPLACAIT